MAPTLKAQRIIRIRGPPRTVDLILAGSLRTTEAKSQNRRIEISVFQFRYLTMDIKQLGMINATALANPDVFDKFFGVSVDDFMKTTDLLPAEVIPYLWDETPTDDDDFLWQAIKVPIADYQTAIAPIPRAVELHHVAQKLLGTSGHVVSFPPVIIPYCGGFARFGEFQMEPTSALIQKRRRRSTPFEQLREALSEERY